MRSPTTVFPALASYDFRHLWFGTVTSSVSSWTLYLGANWLAYDITGESSAVGIVSFASLSPYLLSPIAGSIADRFDRRTVVAAARAVVLVVALALAAVAFSGAAEVWHLAVLIFIDGFSRSIETTAEQALMPNTVSQEQVVNAVTLTSAAHQGSKVVGPLAGAPLLSLVGAGGVFAMAAAFCAYAMFELLRVRVQSTGDIDRFGDIVGNTVRTTRYIARTAPVLMIFALVVLHCWLTMSYDSLLPDFATEALNGGELEYNALIVCVGAGAMFASLGVAAVHRDSIRGRLFVISMVGSGLTPLLMSLAGNVLPAGAAAVTIGASQAVFMALSATLLQSVVPDGIRGRVMSLYFMLAAGVMSLQNLGGGILADQVGTPILFAIPGAAYATIVVSWFMVNPRLRAVYRTGRLESPESLPVAVAVA